MENADQTSLFWIVIGFSVEVWYSVQLKEKVFYNIENFQFWYIKKSYEKT